MSKPDPPRRGPVVISEQTVRLAGPDEDAPENPYWAEPEPHPDPDLGCIRRGLCCRNSPGWFAPGEAEQAAALLEMEPGDFVREYLIIDGMDIEGHGRVDVFAPVKLGRDGLPLEPTASRATRLYGYLKGPCVFYQGEPAGCRIYQARPLECRRYDCTQAPEQNISHGEVARLWILAASSG